jgi:hypothetical protein
MCHMLGERGVFEDLRLILSSCQSHPPLHLQLYPLSNYSNVVGSATSCWCCLHCYNYFCACALSDFLGHTMSWNVYRLNLVPSKFSLMGTCSPLAFTTTADGNVGSRECGSWAPGSVKYELQEGSLFKSPMQYSSVSAPWISAPFLSNSYTGYLFICVLTFLLHTVPEVKFQLSLLEEQALNSSWVQGVLTCKPFLHEFWCFILCGFWAELWYSLTLVSGVGLPPLFRFVKL